MGRAHLRNRDVLVTLLLRSSAGFQMTALSTRPDLVIVAYNEMEPSGLPNLTT